MIYLPNNADILFITVKARIIHVYIFILILILIISILALVSIITKLKYKK